MIINRTTISGNVVALMGASTANSESRGGGMCHDSGFLTASRLRVTRNQANSVRTGAGGGIYTLAIGVTTLSLLTVTLNNITHTLGASGGGLSVGGAVSGRILMTKLVVRNNSATFLGGTSTVYVR
jgi:hypothetical protein